jgi:hypothetical protein
LILDSHRENIVALGGVPVGSREVTVAFNLASERTVVDLKGSAPLITQLANGHKNNSCLNTRQWTKSRNPVIVKVIRRLFVCKKVLNLLQCLNSLFRISAPCSINATAFQIVSRFLLLFKAEDKSSALQKYCKECYSLQPW